jgi:hypothetical protein
MRNVPVPTQTPQDVAVYVGNEVEVLTHDGKTHRFLVTAKEPDALRGENIRIPYADMRKLSVVTSSAPAVAKTTLILVAIALIAAIAYFLDHAGSLAG